MIRIRTLLLVGVAAYLFFVVALLPIAHVKSVLDQTVGRWVAVNQLEGSVGRAEATYHLRDLPAIISKGKAVWRFSVLPLLRMHIGGLVELSHPGLELSALMSRGLGSARITELNGTIDARFLNQLIEPTGLKLAGAFQLQALDAAVDIESRTVLSAAGTIVYEGGRAALMEGGRRKPVTVPPMIATLFVREGVLLAEIKEAESLQLVATAELQPDGWGQLTVLKRLLKITGQGQVSGDENKAFINVKQRIF